MTDVVDFLLKRRSVVANKLGEPGPNSEELDKILRAATRVPDHKGLFPWRFLVFKGEQREVFGEILASTFRDLEPDSSEVRLEAERTRFLRAPVVVATISSTVQNPAVPEWEQILSAGAVCLNMLNAASGLGFSCQWITEWYAYDDAIRKVLKLESNERVAGFVYIGTAAETPSDRNRPDLSQIVSYWNG